MLACDLEAGLLAFAAVARLVVLIGVLTDDVLTQVDCWYGRAWF